jgi:serine/threonine protein kinase
MQADKSPIKDLRVLVDTCSIIDVCKNFGEYSFTFFKLNFGKIVSASGSPIIIPKVVYDELIKNSVKITDDSTRDACRLAIQLVQKLIEEKIAKILGQEDDTFPDNLFQELIIKYCEKYKFCLFTQDKRLALDVLNINNRKSVTRSKGVIIIHLINTAIERWELSSFGQLISVNKHQSDNIESIMGFTIEDGKPNDISVAIPTSMIPGIGDAVTDGEGSVHRLLSALGGGGEGRVYLTDFGLACKIYNKIRITEGLRDKLNVMTKKKINKDGICWPISVVQNRNHEFVGYVMNRAFGKEIQKSIFIKPIMITEFPSWSRIELVDVTINILEKIKILHDNNVILGDINPMNILVNRDGKVFFVDTDSYQIGRYSCPVGTPTFLAPELIGKDLKGFLRTMEHDSFSVSTLVFMLLMPGKPPYSHTGGGDPARNVRESHFPYNLGDRKGKNVPSGPWRFIWSNYPRYLKEAFHIVFTEGKRPTTDEWLQLMERYRNDLKSGFVSSSIFPLGFKRLSKAQTLKAGGTWRICSKCGVEFGDMNSSSSSHSVCLDCRFKPAVAVCQLCKTAFLCFHEDDDLSKTPLCSSCRSNGYKQSCINCGKSYDVLYGEVEYFRQKGLSIPKRCPECRKAKVKY